MPSILENTDAINEYLNGDSMNDIAKRYGVSRVAVSNFLNKHQVDKRKITYVKKSQYNFDEHWLDKLDCQEKWYFLGFFAADGNLDDNDSNYSVRLKISREDKYILERFNELFKSDRPVVDKDYRNAHNKSGIEYCSEWKIGSKYLFNRMIELGLSPRKTLTLKFPEKVPEEYLSHYVRGYFDGDGNINIMHDNRKTKRATITIVGSNYFIPILQEKLKEKNITSFVKKGNTGNYCNLDIDRQEDIKPFLDWIYKDSKIHLTRKYKRYKEYIKGRDFTKEDLGAKRRKIKELEPEIIEDYENGLMMTKIIKKYKISNDTFYKILKRNNIIPISKRGN